MVDDRPQVDEPVDGDAESAEGEQGEGFGLAQGGGELVCLASGSDEGEGENGRPDDALRQELRRVDGRLVEGIPVEGKESPDGVAGQGVVKAGAGLLRGVVWDHGGSGKGFEAV